MVASRAPSVVMRRGLFDRLAAAGQGGVTLLSAPAGSGKTVLLRSWIGDAGLSDRVAWVSVERSEHDAQHFWLAVLAELGRAAGGQVAVEMPTPSPQFDGRRVVERLAADLGSLDSPVMLVVDDLHELRSAEALAQLELLIGRRPPLLSIVLATRHDPRIGLHRLRVAGELTEVRADALRFSVDETRQLLTTLGITLTEPTLSRLHALTEGWAAGLRLAALSLTGNPDPDRFVAELSGSERTIAEYLLAEVLERQPPEVRRLLLRTSLVDRVNGDLADVLTGGTGSEAILQALEEANAFVVSLDVGRTWFRYHHLFAELLRLELRRSESEAVGELHAVAARWWAEHGEILEAPRHAVAAQDWPLAARLLADHSVRLMITGHARALHALLAAFPESMHADPEVASALAVAEIAPSGSLDAAMRFAEIAERRAHTLPPDRRARVGVTLASVRLTIARLRGDIVSVLGQVEPLLAPVSDEAPADVFTLGAATRSVALFNLGIAELWSGRTDESERHLAEGRQLAARARLDYIEMGCLAYSAITVSLRSFAAARPLAEDAVRIADANGWGTELFAGVAFVGLALFDAWQGRLDGGDAWVRRAADIVHPEGEPSIGVALHLTRGFLLAARGRDADAAAAFAEASRAHALHVTPQPIAVQLRLFHVQALARQGDLDGARALLEPIPNADRDWAETRCAVAILQLAEGNPAAAAAELALVIGRSARALMRVSQVQPYLLDAVAQDRLGNGEAVQSDVERALELAEPDGVVLPFLVTPVRDVLERHPRHRTAHAGLLTEILDVLRGSARAMRGEQVAPADELSDGELRVLRYLPSNLSAPEIGAQLYVSTNTVKTHMRHIYEKLGVHSRTEAVTRARALGLLAPSLRRR